MSLHLTSESELNVFFIVEQFEINIENRIQIVDGFFRKFRKIGLCAISLRLLKKRKKKIRFFSPPKDNLALTLNGPWVRKHKVHCSLCGATQISRQIMSAYLKITSNCERFALAIRLWLFRQNRKIYAFLLQCGSWMNSSLNGLLYQQKSWSSPCFVLELSTGEQTQRFGLTGKLIWSGEKCTCKRK